MAFSDLEIRNAWEDSLAAGFTPEQIYQGALANFGVTRDQVDRALANTSNISNQEVQGLFQAPALRTITTSSGQTYNYDDVVNLINARYAEGKTPALAVKSALQLGFPEDVIRTLPGVDAASFEEGKRLIESGAFAEQATGTMADIQQAAPVGSAQYNARIAAGLDAFGFPPEEVAKLTAQGLYGPGKKYDPGPSPELYYSPTNERESGSVPVSNVPGRNVYAPTQQELQNTLANLSSTASQEAMKSYGPNTLENALLSGIVGAITGGLVNPALTAAGLGTVPSYVAAGVGGASGTAATGADRNQILTGGLLSGITSALLPSILGSTPTTNDFLAADVAQLAAQGIPEEQIAQILTQEGVSSTAINAALDAQFGSSIAGSAKGLGDFSSSTASQSVPVAGQNLVTNITDLVGGLFSPATTLATQGVQAPTSSVEVTGKTLPNQNITIEDLLAVLTPSLLNDLSIPGVTNQVEVTGQTDKTIDGSNIISTLVPSIITSIPSTTSPTSATEKVEVTAKKEPNLIETLGPLTTAGLELPKGITNELPKATQPTNKEESLFKPSDILKLIGIIGGLTAGKGAVTGGTGTGVSQASTSPLATTTPQYGDDYYKQLQGYYNTYMPQYPRDVSGPLKAWYEGTFNSPQTAQPGMFSKSTPSAVSPAMREGVSTAPTNAYINSVLNEQTLLANPQYGGQFYGEGLTQLGGLPPNLSKEALAKLFPQGTSKYIPQEVSVSLPDYFGYVSNNPQFDSLFEKVRASQRAFSRAGADPAQQEYEMKNYLNNLAGGLPYTGSVNQGAKPLLPLLTSIDTSQGRLTSDQADALAFIVNNAETYNRLKQDIPVWEKEGNTAYLANQVPYFNQLETALRDYSKKLEGLDTSKLSSKELFSLIPSGI